MLFHKMCDMYHLEYTEQPRRIQIIWNAQHSRHIWIHNASVLSLINKLIKAQPSSKENSLTKTIRY
jgi:hypothetical protein